MKWFTTITQSLVQPDGYRAEAFVANLLKQEKVQGGLIKSFAI